MASSGRAVWAAILVLIVSVAAVAGALVFLYMQVSVQNRSLQSRETELQNELSAAETQIGSLEASITLLRSSIAALQQNITATQAQSEAQIQALQAQVLSLQEQLSSLTAKVAQLEAELNAPTPSVVSTTGRSPGTRDDYKHKVFFAAGLYWAFYQENSGGFGWRTSSDGAHWGAFTSLDPSDNALGVADGANAVYDQANNKVWVVYHEVYNSTLINFRSGIPLPNGSIAWASPNQTEDSGYVDSSPMAAVDSAGSIWNTASIAYCYGECGLPIYKDGAKIAQVNGSLSYQDTLGILVPGNGQNIFAVLGSGDFYSYPLFIYYSADGGTTWHGPVPTSESYLIDGSSAVAVGNTLYIAGASPQGPRLVTYTFGSSAVANETLVESITSNLDVPVADCALSTDSNGNFFLAYTDGQNVYFRVSPDSGATWGPRTYLQRNVQLFNVPFSVDPAIVNGSALIEWQTTDATVWFASVTV